MPPPLWTPVFQGRWNCDPFRGIQWQNGPERVDGTV